MHGKRLRQLVLLIGAVALATVSGPVKANGRLLLPPAAGPQDATYLVGDRGSDPDANPGDGTCLTSGGACTLRAAINEANLDGGPSTIRFASQFLGTSHIGDEGLSLTEPGTTIDASDQWVTEDDRPGVEVCGYNSTLLLKASQTVVKGIQFCRAIEIRSGGHNIVGGEGPGERNVFLGQTGVWAAGGEGYNQILNNYFGTLNGLYAQGSLTRGIWVSGHHNLIAGNLFAGLGGGTGILIEGSDNTVRNNIVGLDKWRQKALPLSYGIKLYQTSAHHNIIGPNNTIAGNEYEGIQVWNACCNTITGNTIGWIWGGNVGNDGHGILAFNTSDDTQIVENRIDGNGGHGVMVHGSELSARVPENALIVGNAIGYNKGDGIHMEGSGSTLRGNGIVGNGGDGIYLSHGPAWIGGAAPGEGNTLVENKGSGVHLVGASNVAIQGNCIGLSQCNFSAGNEGHGILLEDGASGATIGGAQPGQANRIGFNHRDGIRLAGGGTAGNFVQGNFVGAPEGWSWPAPNDWHGIGIYDGAGNNYIGGLGEGMGNVILASGWSGIAIVNSDANFVLGNRIGTDGAGHDWGNGFFGLSIGGANHLVSGNEIAFNGTTEDRPGVLIDGDSSIGNMLVANSIHDHAGPGISLTNRGNEDAVAPVLTASSCQGSLTGRACTGCSVEIFSDAGDEGKVYEGTVTADASTGAFFWNDQPNGPNVTATATDANNNTSPFSLPFAIGVCNHAPIADFTITPANGPVGTRFSFDASSSSDAEDATSALQVRWDWQSDGIYDTSWGTDKVAEHRFDVAATHTIRLQLMDSGGLMDTTSKKLWVSDQTIPARVFLPMARR